MFSGSATSPYDDIVAKTTDENLTTENWELILNLCDKVSDEGQDGARNVIAAILKRLSHRNPNVQLYALSLAEALSKNCGIEVHRELASRAFTQGLEKLITDRTTHDKVKRRALSLIATWSAEFANDTTLGIMEECYNNLKDKNYKFEAPEEAPPPAVDDEIRRKEEEELQRVLEMSMRDRGGRGQWSEYTGAGSSSAGGPSSSSHSLPTTAMTPAAGTALPPASSPYAPPTQPQPYSNAPSAVPVPQGQPLPSPPQTAVAPAPAPTSAPLSAGTTGIVTRVRALHTFEPTEPGELGFQQGDIIKVVDRGYKDWWRGQLKGRTGIFPVNYVEPLPEPTAVELAREAEQEAAVFAQAVNVEKLLEMLRAFDPNKDNLADNEEIQELYRSSMALRPKIVKLIDKYSQKRADLVSMNETFVRARTIFDRMMEESLAKHSGIYADPSGYHPYIPPQQQQAPAIPPQQQQQQPPAQEYTQWNQQPPAPYPGGANPTPAPYMTHATPAPYSHPPAASAPAPGPAPYGSSPYAGSGAQPQHQQPQQQQGPPPAWQAAPPQSPPAEAGYARPTSPNGPMTSSPWPGQQPQPTNAYNQPQHQQSPQHQPHGSPVQAHQHAQQHAAAQPQPYQHQHQRQGSQHQQQQQPQPSQHQPQPQPQPQQKHYTNGPPYIYDPNGTYPDSNAQAWAQYYAAGGKDLTGAVYFISVPGLTDEAGHPLPDPAAGGSAGHVGGLAGQFGTMRVGGD